MGEWDFIIAKPPSLLTFFSGCLFLSIADICSIPPWTLYNCVCNKRVTLTAQLIF